MANEQTQLIQPIQGERLPSGEVQITRPGAQDDAQKRHQQFKQRREQEKLQAREELAERSRQKNAEMERARLERTLNPNEDKIIFQHRMQPSMLVLMQPFQRLTKCVSVDPINLIARSIVSRKTTLIVLRT
jgi:hypothetical protein